MKLFGDLTLELPSMRKLTLLLRSCKTWSPECAFSVTH